MLVELRDTLAQALYHLVCLAIYTGKLRHCRGHSHVFRLQRIVYYDGGLRPVFVKRRRNGSQQFVHSLI